ncbi:hypothetical protein BH23GEM6_BH23GEM6_21460 [soil metagenome]
MLKPFLRLLRNRRSGLIESEAFRAARAAGVSTLREARAAFATEIGRARRYHRPLSLVIVGLDPTGEESDFPNIEGIPKGFSIHSAFFILGSLLRELLREIDVVAYSAEHHVFVLLLPESGEREAHAAARRISSGVRRRIPLEIHAGIAEFPRDGFTLDTLIGHAHAAQNQGVFASHPTIVREASGV